MFHSFASPCTVAHQAALSMESSRQAYWSRLPCPPPGALTNPVIEAWSALQAVSLLSLPVSKEDLLTDSSKFLKICLYIQR